MTENGTSDMREITRVLSGSGMHGLKNRVVSTANLTALEWEGKGDERNQKLQQVVEDFYVAQEEHSHTTGNLLTDVLDISPVLTDAASAVVDDSFLRCFKSTHTDPWNWNLYLFPLWCLGVVIRHGILFPIRLLLLMVGFLIFFLSFAVVHAIVKDPKSRQKWEQKIVQFQCQMFVASWTGVIRYHGPRPVPCANRVWVCNHTSMIDYIVLCAYSPFAVIMQLHPGWVGFLQKHYMACLGCLWFNRTEVKDRQLVAERMKAHVQAPDTTPLLIFPEGTCVNNEYCVMFKRGAFDLGAAVCPIAIKYNKVFVDAFWNSKRQSFTAHLGKLMRSWAVVCDVYFLEPQYIRPGEASQQFAERVQAMIADRARLKVAPWDGYLKYYNLGQKHPDLVEKRRKIFADKVRHHLPHGAHGGAEPGGEEPGSPFAAATAAAAHSPVRENGLEAGAQGEGKKVQ